MYKQVPVFAMMGLNFNDPTVASEMSWNFLAVLSLFISCCYFVQFNKFFWITFLLFLDNFFFVAGVTLGWNSGFARMKPDIKFPVFILKRLKGRKLFTDRYWKDMKQPYPEWTMASINLKPSTRFLSVVGWQDLFHSALFIFEG